LIQISVWAACAIFAVAALRDLGWRSIDNVLVGLSLLSWVGFMASRGGGLPDLGVSVAVGAVAFAVMIPCYALGWIGGGDVKLAAPVFLWAGPSNGLTVLVVVAGLGGVLGLIGGLVMLLCRLPLPKYLARSLQPLSAGQGVPYGVALSAGGIVAALAALPPT